MQCLGLTSARAACSHCTATRHGCRETLITLTRRPLLGVSRALHVLSSYVLCSWRRLPLICLKLLVGVCVRDTLAASVCVYHTYAASVEHLPPGWRAVAFPRWFHDQSCSTWQCHSHSHCSLMLLRRLVCTRQACCLFVHVALLLLVLPLSLFLGIRAPSLSLGRL